MHIKQQHQGSALIQLCTTELALFALAFRHAASNEYLQHLTPLMPTTLESLAATFEMAMLITLEQGGHLHLAEEATLKAEEMQSLCQLVVTEGIERCVKVAYDTSTASE